MFEGNSRHEKTGTEFTVKRLVEPDVTLGEEAAPLEEEPYNEDILEAMKELEIPNRGRSIIGMVNMLDEVVEDMPEFGTQSFEDELEMLKDRGRGIIKILKKTLADAKTYIKPLIKKYDGQADKDPNTLSRIQKLRTHRKEVMEVMAYVRRLRDIMPEQMYLQLATFMRDVRNNFERDGKMATPEQLNYYVQERILKFARDVTPGAFGTLDISFTFDSINDPVHLGNIYKELTEESKKHWFGDFFDKGGYLWRSVWAYASWTVASRNLESVVFDGTNYIDASTLKVALDNKGRPITSDATIHDIWRKVTWIEDGFEVPAVERARASTLIYENLLIIDLIKNKEDEYYLPAAQAQGLSNQEKAEIVLTKKGELLRHQPNLEWLTQDEAEFLIVNITNFMPWEKNYLDTLQETRKTIQLFCASDPVRADGHKVNGEMAYSGLLNKNIKVSIVGGVTKILYIDPTTGTPYDIQDTTSPVDSEIRALGIREKFAKMEKYGERMEQGAYNLFWATFQAMQADGDYTWGFMKYNVALQHGLLYTSRYISANYAQPIPLLLAKSMPRLLKTWTAQAEVNRHGDPTEVESFAHFLADPNINMMSDFNASSHMFLGEAARLSDNLGRAKETFDLINKGLFEFIGVPLKDFHGAQNSVTQIEKIKEGFRKVYKIFKYQAEMFVLDEDVEHLVSNSTVRSKVNDDLKEMKKYVKKYMIAKHNKNVMEMRDSKTKATKYKKSAVNRIVRSAMLDFVTAALTEEFKKIQLTKHTQEEKILEIREKIADEGDTGYPIQLDDLIVLKSVLVMPGAILTGTEKGVDGRQITKRFIDDDSPNEKNSVWNGKIENPDGSTKLMISKVSARFQDALKYAVLQPTMPEKVGDEERVTPFDLYIKKKN